MKQSLTDRITKNWKQVALLIGVIFILNSIIPATLVFRKQEIQYVRIAKMTYRRTEAGEPIFDQEEVVLLRDQEAIDQFASIWSSQLLILPPNWSGISGHRVDENTEDYWVVVSYENDSESINFFDAYGYPIRINDRTLWFSLFRSRKHIYREIKLLFDQYQ